MRKESRIRNPESGGSPAPPGGGRAAPGGAGGKPRDSSIETFEVACTCGRKLLARREHAGKQVACSGCAKVWRLEQYRDPQTLDTRLRTAPIAAKKKSPATEQGPLSGKGQDLLCVCGHSLRVRREHLGRQAQCPACGTLMRLEKDRDPQTQHTVVRAKVVGRSSPPPPRPEKSDWSLEDFR